MESNFIIRFESIDDQIEFFYHIHGTDYSNCDADINKFTLGYDSDTEDWLLELLDISRFILKKCNINAIIDGEVLLNNEDDYDYYDVTFYDQEQAENDDIRLNFKIKLGDCICENPVLYDEIEDIDRYNQNVESFLSTKTQELINKQYKEVI